MRLLPPLESFVEKFGTEWYLTNPSIFAGRDGTLNMVARKLRVRTTASNQSHEWQSQVVFATSSVMFRGGVVSAHESVIDKKYLSLIHI